MFLDPPTPALLMSYSVGRRLSFVFASGTIALLAAACGDDAAGFACPQVGVTSPCTCADGASGEATCLATGVYSVCECDGGGGGADAGAQADVGGADAGGSPDAAADGGAPEPWPRASFFGERECPFTTATFAGEWSPADTTMETFFVTEVEGGFAVAGVEGETPFGSCEVTFDYDGESGALRDPQPCRDGIATYDSGTVVVEGDDFSFDVLGNAMGFTVSLKVDCGAGDVSIGDGDPEPQGFAGAWSCNGEVTAQGGDASFPATFDLNNSQTTDGQFASELVASGDAAPFVQPFSVCEYLWNEVSPASAELSDETACAGASGAIAESNGLSLDGATLSGDVSVRVDGGQAFAMTFVCER